MPTISKLLLVNKFLLKVSEADKVLDEQFAASVLCAMWLY